jgi:branched-chain amino acid transport system permease protein
MAAIWSLLAGVAGQFSFASVAIAGIAAYASAIWGRDVGGFLPFMASPWVDAMVGVVVAGIVGTTLGLVVLRLRGVYLALFTLAFGEIARLVVIAEKDFTGGPLSLATKQFPGNGTSDYYLVLGAMFLVLLCVYLIIRSRVGLFLRAMREDADAAAAMGIDIVRLKILIFGLTSVLTGFMGAIYFQTTPRLTPDALNSLEMGFIIVYAVFGGLESPIAGVVAALVLVFVLEWLRSFQIGSFYIETGVWRYAIFGALLVATLRLAPNGFIAPILTRLSGVRRVSLPATAALGGSAEGGVAAHPSQKGRIDLRLEDLSMSFGGVPVLSGVGLNRG